MKNPESQKQKVPTAKKRWGLWGSFALTSLLAGGLWLWNSRTSTSTSHSENAPSTNLSVAQRALSTKSLPNDVESQPTSTQPEEVSQASPPAENSDLSELEVMRSPSSQHTKKEITSMFGFARVEKSIKTEPDSRGRYLKVDILKTDFKYPMIRVAETRQVNTEKPDSDTVTARSAMVADHLIVRWRLNANPEEIQKFLTSQKAEIRDADAESNITLVSFDGSDPRAMGHYMNSFQSSALVDSVSPDYLASNDPDAN